VTRLRAESLVVKAGGKCLLDGVGIHVASGEIVGLLGPNGAGKTTTFRVLTGLLQPDAGAVYLNDAMLGGPLHQRVRAGLGYLPQTPSLLEGLSVVQQLYVALEARGAPRTAAEGYLERVGLQDRTSDSIATLSGGEIRRLEIARCLATDPRILLLDEPFAGLDPKSISRLSSDIRALADDGLGVLVTDHAVRETMPLCDSVSLLVQGSVVLTGTPQEIAENPTARSRWLGEDWLAQ